MLFRPALVYRGKGETGKGNNTVEGPTLIRW